MFKSILFLFVTGLFTSVCPSLALTAETPDKALADGRYICATVTSDAYLDVLEVLIKRDGDHVTATPHQGEAAMMGKLIGTRLYLIRHEINDLGIEVVQVVGTIRDDGTVRGTATRTLDGLVIERGAFTLRRAIQ
jgi:hypothetical protein